MDSDTIKSFFAQHIEKIVLFGIGAFSLFLIYQGTSYPMFKDTELKPEDLKSKATTVKKSIDDPHNEAVLALLPPEEPKTYPQRIAQLQKQIPFSEYPHRALEQVREDLSIKRIDPKLLAPIELRMTGVLGAMATLGRGPTTYPVMNLENAEPPEVEEEKPKSRDRRRGRRGGSDPMGMGGEEMMMMMMEGDPSMGSDAMMGMESTGPGGMGAMSMTRRLEPKYNRGAKITGNAQAMGNPVGGGTAKPRPLKTIPQSAYFIAGTAALPHKALVESYKVTFEKTKGYKPLRDRPIYLGYDVQRADVSQKSVDELGDDDWVDVDGWERMNLYALSWWDGYAPDVIPADYRDPKLTALIPPLLIYDFTHFATHPKIPLKTMVEIAREEADPMRGRVMPDIFNTDGEQPAGAARGAAAMGNNPMMGGAMGMEMGMESGMGMGMGGMMTAEKNPAEYKMVRFYDFFDPRFKNPPQPGHDYVYRVRVKLEDPNFPENPAMTPTLRSLSPEVFARVVPKIKAAEATKKRDFVIHTPWSEPSPAVRLPRLVNLYAGPIIEPASTKEVTIEQHVVEVVRNAPTAKTVTTVWDWKYAVAVPAPLDVQAGSLLNAKLDAEVVDPLTLLVKTKPNSNVRSNAVVLDITGGEPLQLQAEDDLTRPGMVFVFDPVDGGLKVLEEIDDRFDYNMYTFTDDKPKRPESSATDMMDAMDADYMQMGP